MNIILIDPESAGGHDLPRYLRTNCHAVVNLADHSAVESSMDMFKVDAVLLGVGIDEPMGMAVMTAVRKQRRAIPVLIISRRNSVEDRVRALALGADDYIVAPFHPDELLARILAKTRFGLGSAALNGKV